VRIGVYVDGFNLYYGGRGLCGRGTPGWRWLDLRALASALISKRTNWPDARVSRLVYCTARIDGPSNPSGQADQDVYLKALRAASSVDHIEYGSYVARVKTAPLAVKDRDGRPQLVVPSWPVMIQDGQGGEVDSAVFMVSYANREEKGTDVNVASQRCSRLVFASREFAAAIVAASLFAPVRSSTRYTPTLIPIIVNVMNGPYCES